MMPRLLRCLRGASSVEFAIVAPTFLLIVTGTMEYCRVLWTTQVLNNVAYSAARCATFGTACSTTATVQSHAVNLAASYGIRIVAANVAYTANTTCKSNPAQNRVVVSYTMNSPLKAWVRAMPNTLTGTGCFAT